ncbi:uncharacterized protein LOC141904655 [Tubulanus polymorphus]|uniref:uncharacterized protein LOC141904655 n=1 Tax=Tubulanus polymorphus TaxID=672921 RepID=UPI003DA52775
MSGAVWVVIIGTCLFAKLSIYTTQSSSTSPGTSPSSLTSTGQQTSGPTASSSLSSATSPTSSVSQGTSSSPQTTTSVLQTQTGPTQTSPFSSSASSVGNTAAGSSSSTLSQAVSQPQSSSQSTPQSSSTPASVSTQTGSTPASSISSSSQSPVTTTVKLMKCYDCDSTQACNQKQTVDSTKQVCPADHVCGVMKYDELDGDKQFNYTRSCIPDAECYQERHIRQCLTRLLPAKQRRCYHCCKTDLCNGLIFKSAAEKTNPPLVFTFLVAALVVIVIQT